MAFAAGAKSALERRRPQTVAIYGAAALFFLQATDTKAPGGIEAAMRHYHRMFSRQGVPTAALYHGPATETLQGEGLPIINFGSRAKLTLASGLPSLSRTRKAIATAAGGAKVVAIVHSDLLLGPLKRMFPGLVTVTPCHSDKFTRKKAADHVVTLNPAQHALAQEALKGTSARIHLLGNPFVHAGRSDLPLATDKPFRRVVYCARFVAFKEPLTLLEAYAGVAAPLRPPIVMYGDGPIQADARKFAAATNVNADFPGWVSNPWAQIGPDDLLVTPSNWEGLPYLLLEALSNGVPVLASDIAGNRMALSDGDFGAHFRTGDAADLTRALTDVLTRPLEMRQKAIDGAVSLEARFGAAAFYAKLTQAIAAPL